MLPHGPKPISKNRQIALPADLMDQVHLALGDQVYVAKAEDPEGALLILPVEIVSAWLDRGRRLEPAEEALTDQPPTK
jgi:antitoxin component of MazEF toxin-antitoxin module